MSSTKMTDKDLVLFKEFLNSKNMSNEDKEKLTNVFKSAFLSEDKNITTKKHKKIVRLTNYKNATCKEDLKTMKGVDLKKILDHNNKNKNGSKSDLIDRVWWLLHPNTKKPKNIDLKKRGRPSINKNKGPAFIEDSEEEDDDNIEELMAQYNIRKTWNKIFISNKKISTSGREYYRYRDTRYIFQKNIDDSYIPKGFISESGKFSKIEINVTPIPEELKEIIRSF